eukprot:TRINITY_DN323_c0_g1_i1.p1 TRINITY_DN323_c0_g1~~TRINITY_DN323_c0_g1_i1.p1  ORF type:complete len:580 (+),score=108.41 TRINITY_DN323_c0_g1_i1:187-1926(+)
MDQNDFEINLDNENNQNNDQDYVTNESTGEEDKRASVTPNYPPTSSDKRASVTPINKSPIDLLSAEVYLEKKEINNEGLTKKNENLIKKTPKPNKDIRIIVGNPFISLYQKGKEIILCIFKILAFFIRITIDSGSIVVHSILNYDKINPNFHKYFPYPHDWNKRFQLGSRIDPKPHQKNDDVDLDVISYFFKVLKPFEYNLNFPANMFIYPSNQKIPTGSLREISSNTNGSILSNNTGYENSIIENNTNNNTNTNTTNTIVSNSHESVFSYVPFISLLENSSKTNQSGKMECLSKNYELLKSTCQNMINNIHLKKEDGHYTYIKEFSTQMWKFLFIELENVYKLFIGEVISNEKVNTQLGSLRKLLIDYHFKVLKKPYNEIWKKFLFLSSQLLECMRQHINKYSNEMILCKIYNVRKVLEENSHLFHNFLMCEHIKLLLVCYDYKPRKEMMFLASSKKFIFAFDVAYLSSQFHQDIGAFDLLLFQHNLSILGFKLLNSDSPVFLGSVPFDKNENKLVFCLDLDDTIFFDTDFANDKFINLSFEIGHLDVPSSSSNFFFDSSSEEESSNSAIDVETDSQD